MGVFAPLVGIVGAGGPLACGSGLMAKVKGTDQVTVCFFGDGAAEQGTMHESMNLAAIWKLPVIFVCENNQYGMGVAPTIDALNPPNKARKIDAVLATMERWRWMPRDLGKTHVVLNIPDYYLRVYNGGEKVWQTKVVVGKPDHETPLLTETMKFITLNPTWNVPQSIIYKELLPIYETSDPQIFARQGLKVERNPDGSVRASLRPIAGTRARVSFELVGDRGATGLVPLPGGRVSSPPPQPTSRAVAMAREGRKRVMFAGSERRGRGRCHRDTAARGRALQRAGPRAALRPAHYPALRDAPSPAPRM